MGTGAHFKSGETAGPLVQFELYTSLAAQWLMEEPKAWCCDCSILLTPPRSRSTGIQAAYVMPQSFGTALARHVTLAMRTKAKLL